MNSFYFKIYLLLALILSATACSTQKQALVADSEKLTSIQNHNGIPYTDTVKNASTALAEAKIPMQGAKELKMEKRREKAENVKQKLKKEINKQAQLVLSPNLFHDSEKKWRPREEKINITWKDVLFVFVLLILLALIGGLIHNFLGVGFNLSMLIVAIIGFIVMCIYIWYLNN